MKKIVVAALVLGLATPAFAGWIEEFTTTYQELGIEIAIDEAMQGGNGPGPIVKQAMLFDGLNPQSIVKALYCAGANGQDVTAAAEENNISQLVVTAGYLDSVNECGDRVADALPYSDNAVGWGGPPTQIPPSPGGRGRPFVSPSHP